MIARRGPADVGARWALLLLALAACFGCAPPKSKAVAAPLDRAAVDVLVREACPRLLVRTFPLAGATEGETTGKAWVRHCSSQKIGDELALDVDVLGWQWVGAGSWGFDVREYVYFRASVHTRLRAAIVLEGATPALSVWSESAPDLDVRALGRVSAHAANPAASLFGVASGIVGKGPNDLATAALRHGVADKLRSQAKKGFDLALADAFEIGGPDAVLLREKQMLFPGGALISGSFAPNIAATLRFDVGGAGKALVRAVCVDDALPLVDAVLDNGPAADASPPQDVLVLEGHGEVSLGQRPCPWFLVTGAGVESPISATFEVARGVSKSRSSAPRWAEVTLLAYHLDGGTDALLGFTLRSGERTSSFGHPLTRRESPSVWLAAPAVEVGQNAPIAIEVQEWKPRQRSFWNPAPAFDRTALGEATIVPSNVKREQRRIDVKRGAMSIGWVEVAVVLTEVE